MKKLLLLILPLFLLFSCSDNSANINKEPEIDNIESFYDKDANSIIIRWKELTKVPDFNALPYHIKEETTYISLWNNKITSISSEDFDMFPSLENINLWFNSLEEVDFSNDTIKEIWLHKNKISKVSLSWDNIIAVTLWFNQIKSTSDIKLPRKNLQYLTLNWNKITDIKNLNKYYNLILLRLEFNDINLEEFTETLSELPNIKFVTTAWNKNIPQEKVNQLNKWSKENMEKYNLNY